WGEPRDPAHSTRVHEAPFSFWGPAALPALTGLFFGLTSFVLDPLVNVAAQDATHRPVKAHLLLWHGFKTPLGMSALVIVLGILVVWRTRGGKTLSDRSLAPVKGVSIFETLHAGTIRLGRRTGDLTRSDSPAFHLGVTTVVLVIMAGAVLALGVDVPPP